MKQSGCPVGRELPPIADDAQSVKLAAPRSSGGRRAGRDWHRILDEIAAAGVTRIAFITLTREHADHCRGAARLAAEPGARVYAPAAIVTALADADKDAPDLTAARRTDGVQGLPSVLVSIAGVDRVPG